MEHLKVIEATEKVHLWLELVFLYDEFVSDSHAYP